MQRQWLGRMSVWFAVAGVAFALAQPRDGWSPRDESRVPEKTEHRRARLGPDSPDEALRYIMLAMRDENGNIPENGLMNARRQVDVMRQVQARARLQALAAGEPDPAAGITNGSWTWIGPGNIGGRTRAIAINPGNTQEMFAGSVSGGIWHSTDGGGSWNIVDDFMTNLAVTSIVFQPNNFNVLYAATGEGFGNIDNIRGAGIFKSVDGGTTWGQLSSTTSTPFNFVTELAFSADSSTLLAATTQGIYRSTDGGATFPGTNLSVSVNVQDVKFLPGSSSEAVAAGRTKNAYFSTDGGATWTLASGMTLSGSSKRVELAVSVSTPNVVYASVAEGQTTGSPNSELWVSTDNGHSYSLKNSNTNFLGAQGWYDNAIWVDPTNDQHVIVGGVSLFRSLDGGATLSTLSTTGVGGIHPDHHVIVSDPGFNGTTNRRIYFGNDGGLYKIENLATTIATSAATRLNNNYGVTQFYGGASVTSGKIFGGTQDNGTLLYNPASGPQGWIPIAGGDGGMATGDQTDPNFMYGEFQWLEVHRNSTGGASGSTDISGCSPVKAAPFSISDCVNQTTNFISPILLDPNNANRLLAGGQNLWRTNDPRTATTSTTGPTWEVIKTSNSSSIATIAIQNGNSDRIWIGHNNGSIFITDNGTASPPTWTQISKLPLPTRTITQISLDPFDASVAYVSFGGFTAGNVWKTPDSGQTWVNISGSGGTALPSAPVRTIVPHPTVAGWLYAGTDVGIFASTDGGATWKLPQDGPANVAVFQLFWATNTKLVAVTHGRGMYTADVPPPSTPATIITHPQSQTVAMGSTPTLSVVATGSAPFTYQWYQGTSGSTISPIAGATSATFTTPPMIVPASFWVRVTNGFGTADSLTATVTPQNGIASYDPGLKAPKCSAVGSSCDTGPTLILGRANITGGAEPNQPNTINNSCADGTSGTFHSSSGQSIDALKVSTLDASPLAVGKTVKIDVTAFINSLSDRVDVYGAPNASSPVWTLIRTFTPVGTGVQSFSDSTYVLPTGAQQAIRANIRPNGTTAAACTTGTTDDHDDLIFAVNPSAGVEMVTNGDFASGVSNWFQWEVPFIVSSVTNGMFQFFLNDPTQTHQATIFQQTGQPVVSGGPLAAQFDLGNSSTVRKRISVLLVESDFSDIAVCTFWLPPNQTTPKPYKMRSHTAKAWLNASIYFYAATQGASGGNYLVDNVSLKYMPTQTTTDRTECEDPNRPANTAGVASANLLTNGDFASGALTPWSAVQPITTQITSGVLQFLRPDNTVPAGVIMQSVGTTQPPAVASAVQDQLFTSTFSLGNSSNVRKRVTVLIHDANLATNPDLMACTFMLPPGMPLSNYTMRGRATQAWTNATISFYPATVGLEQWILLDNVTLQKTAPTATSATGIGLGTECIEPNTISFPIASGGGAASGGVARPKSTATAPSVQQGGSSGSELGFGGLKAADDPPVGSGGGTWSVDASSTRVNVLRWADPIDLTRATEASVSLSSLLSLRDSSAEVQVSRDGGMTWETLELVPPTPWYTSLTFDLRDYLGGQIYIQFVFNAVAPPVGVEPDSWRFYDAVVNVRTGKGGR